MKELQSFIGLVTYYHKFLPNVATLLKPLYELTKIMVTDNQPLSFILRSGKTIPQITAMRLQRYAVFLAGLNYDILHRTAAKNANADSLSRLPLPSQRTAVDTTDKLHINMLQELPIHHKEVRRSTQHDAVLSRVYTSVQTGKWADTDNEFLFYYTRRTDISTQLGCLLWRARVAIPPSQ